MVFLERDIKDTVIFVVIVGVLSFAALIIIAFLRDQGQLSFMGVGLIGAIINPITSFLNGIGNFIGGFWNGLTRWMTSHLSIYVSMRYSTA